MAVSRLGVVKDDIADCYRMLELDPGAPAEAVRIAYRDLVKVWHPDRFAHDSKLQQKAQDRLREINLAYERLQEAQGSGSGFRASSTETNGPPHAQARSSSGHGAEGGSGEPPPDKPPLSSSGGRAAGGWWARLLRNPPTSWFYLYGMIPIAPLPWAPPSGQGSGRVAVWLTVAACLCGTLFLGGLWRSGDRSAPEVAEIDGAVEFDLACDYFTGTGRPKDFQAAFYHASRSAEAGHRGGQSVLALIYFEGKGVAQNYKEAFRWMRLGAEQGNEIAQGLLGGFYERGIGVPVNKIEAYKWYTIAAASGDEKAVESRDALSRSMDGRDIAKAQESAAAIVPRKEVSR